MDYAEQDNERHKVKIQPEERSYHEHGKGDYLLCSMLVMLMICVMPTISLELSALGMIYYSNYPTTSFMRISSFFSYLEISYMVFL
jgi:hypothetical protein